MEDSCMWIIVASQMLLLFKGSYWLIGFITWKDMNKHLSTPDRGLKTDPQTILSPSL